MKAEFTIMGIVLCVLIGWFVGLLIEHPPGPGGFQVFGALLGGMIAIAVLVLGEALSNRKAS